MKAQPILYKLHASANYIQVHIYIYRCISVLLCFVRLCFCLIYNFASSIKPIIFWNCFRSHKNNVHLGCEWGAAHLYYIPEYVFILFYNMQIFSLVVTARTQISKAQSFPRASEIFRNKNTGEH